MDLRENLNLIITLMEALPEKYCCAVNKAVQNLKVDILFVTSLEIFAQGVL